MNRSRVRRLRRFLTNSSHAFYMLSMRMATRDRHEMKQRVRWLESQLEHTRDELVGAWHQGYRPDDTLHDVLGMTWPEYGEWVSGVPRC